MSRQLESLTRLAAQQHGVVTLAQALAAGLTRRQIDSRLRNGAWIRMGKGVYRIAGAPATWHQAILGAVLIAGRGAVASQQSAARVWSVPGFGKHPLHVLREASRSRAARSGKIHETNWLPPSHVRNVDGIPVTSPERTAFDLCAALARRPKRAETAIANLLRRDLTSVGRLAVVLGELGGRGRDGTVLLRSIVAKNDDGQPIAESDLEELVLAVIRAAGLPEPRRQVTVGGTSAPIGRVDFLYEAARLVIEADSRAHHGQWLDQERDGRRDLQLRAAGFEIIRVTWRTLTDEPDLFIAALQSALERVAA